MNIENNQEQTITNNNIASNINNVLSNNTLSTNKNNTNQAQETINSYYQQLNEKYNQLSKEYDNLVYNDYSQAGAFFRPWSAEKYRQNMQKIRNERDKTYELLTNAEAKAIENRMNIENLKNKYKYEKESLKSVGVNNPYFMLRNGSLANNVNLTSSINGGNYNTKYQKTNVPKTWETLLKAMDIIGKFSKKNNKKDSGNGIDLTALLSLLAM